MKIAVDKQQETLEKFEAERIRILVLLITNLVGIIIVLASRLLPGSPWGPTP